MWIALFLSMPCLPRPIRIYTQKPSASIILGYRMKKTRSVKKSTDVISKETGSRLLPTRSTILMYGILLNIKIPKMKITHGRHEETA